MSLRLCAAIVLSAGVACAAGARACMRAESWPGPALPAPRAQPDAPAASTPALAVDLERPHGDHPRILLTPERLAGLRGLHPPWTPSWRRLVAQCDEDAGHPIDAGYEAWDWANATLDLALCGAVSTRPEYTRAAVQYFRALLDDGHKVGDGAGGDAVVRHDDGYSIRTRGCFGAIAYDWLHDSPEMTAELRKHAVDRFVAWNGWFGESGYSRDQPIANYYVGWFGALAFGGIAAQGDDPRATDLLRAAQRMYGSGIVPSYTRKLAGGDFPEGWQYGDMVGAILAIFADAESPPGAARSSFDELPWLRQTLAFRAHALWPDGKHMLDTGDWSEKPAVAPTHTLLALATVLPPADEASSRARALARLASDPQGEEWHWLAALGDDPTRVTEDPRRDATSYLSRGTGTVTARTDWSREGVWFAITSAPALSDHQHLDAGHFEVVRGSDPLLVDAGGYGSYSSLSHNVIAIDDRRDNDRYAPSQGVWGDAAAIARHEDEGRFVYALADYASAYDPSGYPEDHPARSVSRAEREVVFSRSPVPGLGSESARVVVYDRVTLTKPSYAATFLLHGAGAPLVQGAGLRFSTGRSVAFATTLLPAGAAPVVVPEPTSLGDGPYFANDPPEGTRSVRVEVRSSPGDRERRFLHAIVVAGTDARAPSPAAVRGEAVDGVAIEDEAYVFQRAGVQLRAAAVEYEAPVAARRHVVASLAPHARYAVSARPDGAACRVSFAPGEGRVASDAGLVVLDLGPGCVITPPSRAPRPVAVGAP
jgi:Heparinase II/III-like protein